MKLKFEQAKQRASGAFNQGQLKRVENVPEFMKKKKLF